MRRRGRTSRGAQAATSSIAAAALVALGLAPAHADNGISQTATQLQVADNATAAQRPQPAPVTAQLPQRWSLTFGGLYTHREGETSGWLPDLAADYSVNDRLMLHAMAPFTFDRLRGSSTHYGLGDLEIGARYRFFDDDPSSWQPAVSFYPLVDFPTGDVHENLGTGRTHVFLPLWLSKAFGPWIPYGGGGYWINPGPNNKDWLLASLGLIRVLNEQWSLTGEVFHATSNKVGIKEQTGFDIGARFNMNANNHVVFTIGRGVQNANVTNEATAYLADVLTF